MGLCATLRGVHKSLTLVGSRAKPTRPPHIIVQYITIPIFFNTFLFPQVFPQGVWKTIILVLRIADVHWRVPMRSIVGY